MRNGRNQNEMVADLLSFLSEEVTRLRAENNRLRLGGPGHDDLRNFLDTVADLVAAHPFAQTAPTYFAVTLQRARERVE